MKSTSHAKASFGSNGRYVWGETAALSIPVHLAPSASYCAHAFGPPLQTRTASNMGTVDLRKWPESDRIEGRLPGASPSTEITGMLPAYRAKINSSTTRSSVPHPQNLRMASESAHRSTA